MIGALCVNQKVDIGLGIKVVALEHEGEGWKVKLYQ